MNWSVEQSRVGGSIEVMSVCSCVKGSMPKVGDKVMVEASYNANMPFKWNAICVQLLTGPQVSVTVTD